MWLHQPDNYGTTKDQLHAYAKRFNEYGQQYAAIDGKYNDSLLMSNNDWIYAKDLEMAPNWNRSVSV